MLAFSIAMALAIAAWFIGAVGYYIYVQNRDEWRYTHSLDNGFKDMEQEPDPEHITSLALRRGKEHHV